MELDMWEGRQLLGTIFVRWRRKRLDCLFLFSHRYLFNFPTVYLLLKLNLEFRLGAPISASTCFIPWHLTKNYWSGMFCCEAFHFVNIIPKQ
ncbi:hypothetical protein RJT34_29448 [Clitoria ternatea]|uniref:Uncharacterized protein n=1 Tax=Clitoria ternatea TaxID=43366 RepID=A0AAN9FEB3_CLITE